MILAVHRFAAWRRRLNWEEHFGVHGRRLWRRLKGIDNTQQMVGEQNDFNGLDRVVQINFPM